MSYKLEPAFVVATGLSRKLVLAGMDLENQWFFSDGSFTESGNWYSYTLPKSKLEITLATVNHSKENLFICNEHWHGDTKGFYPDFWCADYVLENVKYLTGDFELGGF